MATTPVCELEAQAPCALDRMESDVTDGEVERIAVPSILEFLAGARPRSTIRRPGCWRSGILFGAILFSAASHSQAPPPLNKDFEEKPWEEQVRQIPAYPKESNLRQIDVGPVTNFRFFVDTDSINVGTDGVVRFTLVARSDSGGSNVSFEGMRCQTVERKIYSIGRQDGTWVAARNPNWVALARPSVNPVHAVLYEDYFCPGRLIVSNHSEAVDSVKYGGHPRGRTKVGR